MLRFILITFAIVFAFVALGVGIFSSALGDLFSLQWGTVNFFDLHGIFFLLFVAIFPRLTLLFSSVPFGGILWWVGWFVAPRLLVAILATFAYLQTNPFLVIISWLFVFAGEGGEKYYVYKKAQGTRKDFSQGESIEVKFTRK